MMSNTKRENKICERCFGHGSIFKEECTDYHNREYDWIYKGECPQCKGVGIVTVITNTFTTVEIVPFERKTK